MPGGRSVPIPTFQEVMLPFLDLTADGEEHQLQQAIADLARVFGLTDDERAQLLPSGFQATFTNRVAWAATPPSEGWATRASWARAVSDHEPRAVGAEHASRGDHDVDPARVP